MNPDNENKRTIGGNTVGLNQAETSKHSLTAARFAFFSDNYELLGVIGEGGMGVVYKARQIHLNRLVAIKTLRTAGYSQQALKRFEREAKAASGLVHPNLITIRDYGVDNESQPYMIFDFIDGLTLSELIGREGQIEVDKALDVFIQLAKGLSYAHHRGVLHRDIKPSNIIISGDYREVKIVDFGIAKVLDTVEGEQKLTQTGEIFGTPLYMSPEQSAGKMLDARSDLYSLGCVLFEALTAIPPLVGESAITTIIKHQNEVPPTLRKGLRIRAWHVVMAVRRRNRQFIRCHMNRDRAGTGANNHRVEIIGAVLRHKADRNDAPHQKGKQGKVQQQGRYFIFRAYHGNTINRQPDTGKQKSPALESTGLNLCSVSLKLKQLAG